MILMIRKTIGLLLTLLLSMNLFAQDEVKIAAVGDIMMGTAYPNGEFLPNFDPAKLFDPLRTYLTDVDVTFGNLEGALTDNMSQAKNCTNKSLCYFFAMPTSYAKHLKDAGFDVLSIANNHMSDFGEIGRKSTQKVLKEVGIRYAGLLECPTDIFTINGVKYGFCAFAPNTGTVDVKNIAAAQEIVRSLKKNVDIVIVSFHAGGEGAKFQHVTRKTETCFGENRGNVYEFAHKMIDAGGDVLLGHGPHVTRAIEVYKNRFITYSMGNFLTYSRINVAGVNGLAPLFHIYTKKNGEFIKAQIIPTSQLKQQPPELDKQKRVIKVIQDLTRTDFPEMKSVITIADDGWVTPVK